MNIFDIENEQRESHDEQNGSFLLTTSKSASYSSLCPK